VSRLLEELEAALDAFVICAPTDERATRRSQRSLWEGSVRAARVFYAIAWPERSGDQGRPVRGATRGAKRRP
jgi:hypothetical protein